MRFEPDPASYRQDVSPRGMALAVLFAAAGVGFGVTPTGQRWIGADARALIGVFVVYVIVYGTNVGLMQRGERLLEPGWWPMRAVGCVMAATLGCCFAAASHHDASPAWALHLIIGMAIGLAIRPTRWMLPVLLLPPLGLRAAFVPEATPLSYAISLVTSLGAYALFDRTSSLILRERQLAARAAAAGSLAREAESLSAEFRVAMSLHDGLSGALLALRHRLSKARSVEEARQIVRPWLLRAQSFSYRPSADGNLEAALQRLADSLGIALDLQAEIHPEELTPAERADLRWIASELVANAAAHDPNAPLKLAIRGDRSGVSLEANVGTNRIPRKKRGRGLRNVELRAALHGGSVSWTERSMRIAWQHRESLEALMRRATVELVLIVGAFVALLLVIDRSIGPLVIAVAAVLFVIVAFWDRFSRTARAEKRLELAAQQRLAAEEGELLLLAGEALVPGVRQTEEALANGHLDELGPCFDALAAQLRRLMWALEWTGDAETLREDVADFAREAGVAPPRVTAGAATSPRERWRLVAELEEATPGAGQPTA